MTKQLMIYENAVPISPEEHRNISVRQGTSFGFAAALNSVPLVVAEFEKASAEYPIIFAGEGEAMTPALVVGLRTDENLCVNADGTWDGDYVPAFLRRYPFVFSGGAEDEPFTLCIDTAFDGVNEDGKGERLFDSEGNCRVALKSETRRVRLHFLPFIVRFDCHRAYASCTPLRDVFNRSEQTLLLLEGAQ